MDIQIKCNCLNDVEIKIIEIRNETNQDVPGFKIIKSYWKELSLYPTKQLSSTFINEYIVKSKKGKEIHRTETITIFYGFCPFCGKPYSVKEEDKMFLSKSKPKS